MEKMISIPAARFAADEDAALKAKREELKKRLLEGKKVMVGRQGNVMGKEKDAVLVTPENTKLAGESSDKKRIKWWQLITGILLVCLGIYLFTLC